MKRVSKHDLEIRILRLLSRINSLESALINVREEIKNAVTGEELCSECKLGIHEINYITEVLRGANDPQ